MFPFVHAIDTLILITLLYLIKDQFWILSYMLVL